MRLAAVVMAGGLGTRMRSARPKHLHPLLGRRMVDWAIEAVRPLAPAPFLLVCAAETENELAGTLPPGVETAVQQEPRGTGDAVAAARERLAGHTGDVLVTPGDAPLVTTEVLRRVVEAHEREGVAATVLSVETEKPLPYGRIVRDTAGAVQRIVEERDATPEERAIRELNASFYVFRAADLLWALERLDAENDQGELLLTDTIGHLAADGRRIAVSRTTDLSVTQGVNTRVELAEATAVLRARILREHMLAGVTVVDPASTWIEPTVEIEPDAVVHPYTTLRGTTRVDRKSVV